MHISYRNTEMHISSRNTEMYISSKNTEMYIPCHNLGDLSHPDTFLFTIKITIEFTLIPNGRGPTQGNMDIP